MWRGVTLFALFLGVGVLAVFTLVRPADANPFGGPGVANYAANNSTHRVYNGSGTVPVVGDDRRVWRWRVVQTTTY